MSRLRFCVVLGVFLSLPACSQEPKQAEKLDLKLPNKQGSLKIGVIGDQGTGEKEQYQLAKVMSAYRKLFPFELVIMNGDNLYGSEGPKDFETKFEKPYKELLDGGVKFYASLGNHDNPNERFYKMFNMNGQRYYTFKPRDGVRFYALDTTYLGEDQLQWYENELKGAGEDWKITFFHHPPYSSGKRHGPSLDIRSALEPLFIKYGVQVVFTGHEHFYERLKPQKGVQYFIEGASGQLRKGNIAKTDQTAVGYDEDQSFMLVEIDGDQMSFQAINRSAEVVDSGVLNKKNAISGAQSATAGQPR